ESSDSGSMLHSPKRPPSQRCSPRAQLPWAPDSAHARTSPVVHSLISQSVLERPRRPSSLSGPSSQDSPASSRPLPHAGPAGSGSVHGTPDPTTPDALPTVSTTHVST